MNVKQKLNDKSSLYPHIGLGEEIVLLYVNANQDTSASKIPLFSGMVTLVFIFLKDVYRKI